MKARPAVTAALLAAAFFLISWFLWTDSRHFIDGGDVFFPVDQLLLFSKIGNIWWPDQLGSVAYNISVVPLRALFAALQWVGISSIGVQRLFLAAGYAVAAGGMYLCAREFWRERATPIVAAIWYPCSITYSLAIPNENNVVALAIVPVLIFLGLRAIDDLLYVVPFAAVAVLFGFVAANPPTLVLIALVVAVFWLIGAYDRSSPKRVAATAVWLLASAAAANFWWFAAAKTALGANAMVAAGVKDLSWALERTNLVSILEQTSFWGFGAGSDPWLTIGRWYLQHPIPHTALVLTPVLAFSVLYFRPGSRDRRIRLTALTIVCVAAVLLAKGEAEPFSGVNAWLYANVPGMFLFREPVKFSFVLALGFSLLAAVAHYELAARAVRPAVYAIFLLFIGVPVVTGWAVLTGWAFSLSQSQARTQIPAYWGDAARFLNRRNAAHERVLLLPEDGFYQAHYTWGLDGVDRIAETSLDAPVIRLVANQYAYLQNPYAGKALENFDRALRSQRADWIRNEFTRLSVRYAIVRGDVSPDGRTMSLAEVRRDLRLAGARRIARFGPLNVYEVVTTPRVAAPETILRSCVSPAAELQLAMRLAPDVSVIRSYTAACRRDPSSMQAVSSKAAAVAAGAVVLTERLNAESVSLALHARSSHVPTHLRVAPYGDGMRSAKSFVPAVFCGAWRFEETKTGPAAHRLVCANDAAYIHFSPEDGNAKDGSVALKIRWLGSPADVPIPFGATLAVPVGAARGEISLDGGPSIPSMDRIRSAAASIRATSVFSSENLPARSEVFYPVNRTLRPGLAVNGIDEAAEFLYRLPSGRIFSTFVKADVPTTFDALRPFERAYQSPETRAGGNELRLNAVRFEGVIFPFERSAGAAPVLTLTLPSPDRWSVVRLQHPSRVASAANARIYVGRPVAVQKMNVRFESARWWNQMQVHPSSNGWVVMRQAYTDDFAMPGSTTHAVLDGYANAWYVPRAGSYTAFIPFSDVQRILYAASALCVLAIAGAALLLRRRQREAP